MDALDGIWRLVESRAWDEQGRPLPAPYGERPMGQILFANGRMLSALCNGDASAGGDRAYSSYGGRCTFDGTRLETLVDMASDASRVGSTQVREVLMLGAQQMLLRPPARLYGASTQRRELVWERVWRPKETMT